MSSVKIKDLIYGGDIFRKLRENMFERIMVIDSPGAGKSNGLLMAIIRERWKKDCGYVIQYFYWIIRLNYA